jgi:hypothetical protein
LGNFADQISEFRPFRSGPVKTQNRNPNPWALLDRVLPELFALPAEAKQRNVSNEVLYGGYIGQLPGLAYESVCIHDVANAGSISDFFFRERAGDLRVIILREKSLFYKP